MGIIVHEIMYVHVLNLGVIVLEIMYVHVLIVCSCSVFVAIEP